MRGRTAAGRVVDHKDQEWGTPDPEDSGSGGFSKANPNQIWNHEDVSLWSSGKTKKKKSMVQFDWTGLHYTIIWTERTVWTNRPAADQKHLHLLMLHIYWQDHFKVISAFSCWMVCFHPPLWLGRSTNSHTVTETHQNSLASPQRVSLTQDTVKSFKGFHWSRWRHLNLKFVFLKCLNIHPSMTSLQDNHLFSYLLLWITATISSLLFCLFRIVLM